MSITRRTFACLAAATLTQSPALAQEWPGKQPIRIIVPYRAIGGGIQCRSEASLDKEKLGSSGDPYPTTSAELRARLARDIDAYGAVIRATIK
jgi:hypothetical protein